MSTTQLDVKFRVATAADADKLVPLIRSAYRGEDSRAGWTTEADFVIGDRIDAAGLVAKIETPDSVLLYITTTKGITPQENTNGITLVHNDPDAANVNTNTEADDVLVACCEILSRGAGQRAYFGLFAVDPRRQGGGLGRTVLAYAEAYARTRWGSRQMEMQVIGQRGELIDWYARRGYRKSGETRPFPVEEVRRGQGDVLRPDLYFEVLVKDLGTPEV